MLPPLSVSAKVPGSMSDRPQVNVSFSPGPADSLMVRLNAVKLPPVSVKLPVPVVVPTVPGAVSLLDAFTVEECIAAIASAKLFIGIDSGLLHMAAAMRTPAVGLWGCTSPRFFYAENVRKNFVVSEVACQGCYHRLPRLHWITGCPHDIQCMKQISVEEVLRACLAKLDIPDGSQR